MINYSICQEKKLDYRKILTMLLMIDSYESQYTCCISCDENTKKYVNNFPYVFSGDIHYVCNMVDNESYIDLIKRKFNLLHFCVEKYNNTLHLSPNLFLLRKLKLPEFVKSIMFVKKHGSHAPGKEEQQYGTDMFYINNIDVIDYLSEELNSIIENDKIVDNQLDDNQVDDNQSDDSQLDDNHSDTDNEVQINTNDDVIIKCKKWWAGIALTLIEKYGLDTFFSFNYCVGTEDFFTYDNSLKFAEINDDFSYIFSEKDEKGSSSNDLSSNDLSSNDLSSEDVSYVSQEYPIYFVNIRIDQLAPAIQTLNKCLFSKLVSYKITYMAMINLRLNAKNMEFIVPKRDGIVIWNRKDDPPGLYELIDLMIEPVKKYFTRTEVDIEYFSFNNFLLFDKNDKIWLSNNTRKYTDFFICNYNNELPKIIESEIPIPSRFLCYYSDYPKKLLEFADKNITKVFDYISIIDETIHIYNYNNDSSQLEKCKEICIKDFNWEEKYNIISKSKFIKIDKIDVHLLANCLGLKVVPVVTDKIELLDLISGKHYVEDSCFPHNIGNYDILSNECKVYYNKNIIPNSVLKKILNHVFVRDI
jgi:hypothetical protein